jgi:TPR repeat protein
MLAGHARLIVGTLSLLLGAAEACKTPGPAGLDEAQIAASARGPDAPPLPSGWAGSKQTECNAGDEAACTSLGTAFQYGGNAVAKDEARATRLFWKACEKASSDGCLGLGNAFSYGFGGTRKDMTAAKKQYRRACDLGNPAACLALKSL